MTRVFALVLLAALPAQVVAAEPASRNFGTADAPLPDGGKFRVGRPTHFTTTVLAFSADGRTLAAVTNQHYTSGIDVPVDLWNVETGEHIRSLHYHKTGVMAAAFTPDGSILATSGIDNRLRFWDGKTGKDITKQEIPLTGHGYNLTFSPDGKRLLVGSTNLELYDVATQQPVKKDYFAETAGNQFFHTATWSPKGKYIAAACDGQGVRIWDADGKLLYQLTDKYTPHRTRFVFSADDKLILLATWPAGLFKVFDAETGKEQREVKTPTGEAASEQVQFAREMGRVAWVVNKQGGAATIAVSDATGAELKRIPLLAGALSHMLSHDGKHLAVGGSDGSLRVYEADTGRLEHTMLAAWSPVFRAVYADGGKVLRTIHTTGAVHDFNATTGKHLKERKLPLEQSMYLIAVSADGSLLASATDNGTCTIWNLNTGEAKAKPKGTLFGHREMQFGPGGPFPLPPPLPPPPRPRPAPNDDAAAAPPPPPPGRPGGAFPPPPPLQQPSPPQFVGAFSADGKLFAAATGKDDSVTMWDAATGAELHSLKVPTGVGSVAISTDGTHVFVGTTRSGSDEVPIPVLPRPGAKPEQPKEPEVVSVRRYDLKTGKEVQSWKAAPGEKRPGLRFTRTDVVGLYPLPDKQTLLVVEDQVYTTWPPPPGAPGGRVPESRFKQARIIDFAGRAKDVLLPGMSNASRLSVSPDGKAVGFVAQNGSDPNKPATLLKVVQVPSGKTASTTLASGSRVGFNEPGSQGVRFRPGSADVAVRMGDGTVLVLDGAKLK